MYHQPSHSASRRSGAMRGAEETQQARLRPARRQHSLLARSSMSRAAPPRGIPIQFQRHILPFSLGPNPASTSDLPQPRRAAGRLEISQWLLRPGHSEGQFQNLSVRLICRLTPCQFSARPCSRSTESIRRPLHGLRDPGFAEVITAARFAEIFARERKDKASAPLPHDTRAASQAA